MSASPLERTMCWGCRRPASVCYCAAVRPIVTRTRVVILQHPRERDVPINTARIAALCLPQAEVHVGVAFSQDELRAVLADAERPPVLLFPSEEARDLAAEPPDGPVTLVVLDGTWWQAEKLYKSNACLRVLPHYELSPSAESRYRIRREPAAHCLSTIEALVQALGVLEGQLDAERLLAPFERMVETQLEFVRAGARPRRRAPARYVDRSILPELGEHREHVVLGYGEANAWPYGTPGAPEPEVVHWVATRWATGERFEAYLAPVGALAPSLFKHTGLARERVVHGESLASFAVRWSAFVRPDDLLGGWGFYAARLLRDAGVAMPPALDLRAAAIRLLGRRAGELDDYLDAFGITRDSAWADGRTGQRLAAVETLARHLAGATKPRRVRPLNVEPD